METHNGPKSCFAQLGFSAKIFLQYWYQCDDPSKVVESGNDAQLNGRMGPIEEMGKICLFLAADATFCTGIGHF